MPAGGGAQLTQFFLYFAIQMIARVLRENKYSRATNKSDAAMPRFYIRVFGGPEQLVHSCPNPPERVHWSAKAEADNIVPDRLTMLLRFART